MKCQVKACFTQCLRSFFVLALAFCLSVFATAQRANENTLQNVEQQLLRVLEENGVSGLAAAFDQSRNIVLPGTDQLVLALWQVRGARKRVLLETAPGAATVFETESSNTRLGAQAFSLTAVDVSGASQDWALPMTDVALVFGMQHPSFEIRRARFLSGIVVCVSVAISAILILLQVAHWQRYRRSLQSVNALLHRYSKGETGIRFEDQNPAPELRELGRQLNDTLPKLDGLFADLRALSAHMAHELRTPLQNIRSGVRKLVRADTLDERKDHAQRIDAGIDGADARLMSVMQLFRLQATGEVALDSGVELGAVLEDIVFDFEEVLQQRDRTLGMQIDTAIRIRGNKHLLELMIANLLTNAAKYTPDGGDISLALHASDGRFELTVCNTGQLSENLKETAFERYAQGREHSNITGFGLGLGLVNAIAQKHSFKVDLTEAKDENRVVARILGRIENTPKAGSDA
ncbi:MAG: HAMP domain-containing sensor histidine kinase [Pseudomonadota bacterium]